MLPEPALTLTLPSIHDGTVLDCRIYHPASLLATNPRAPPWRRHAAVVAHPYAPLGGSYDDPIVDTIAAQLLRKGFLVGTFNFRGAAHSAGRTSWTSKPERDDYVSFVGFLVYYIHYLNPFRSHHGEHDGDVSPLPTESRLHEPLDGFRTPPSPTQMRPATMRPQLYPHPPVLLLAGYSYGAMVTTQLPPLSELLEPFASPLAGSDAAQIRLRAENLAVKQNLALAETRAAVVATARRLQQPRTPTRRSASGVRVGGDESSPGSPRASHDGHGRRSFSHDAEERLRKGVNELLAKAKPRHGRHASRQVNAVPEIRTSMEKKPEDERLPKLEELISLRPSYLLISPLQGIVNHLATMSLLPTSLTRSRDRDLDRATAAGENAAEAKLVQWPTMAVYGDRDVFVPVGKLRTWADRLRARPETLFRAHEIGAAGHFWVEEGVLYRMRDLVGSFAEELLQDG
ncbi:GPI transamidase component PIG-S [Paramyrothecium foliicola]|nr:GPI transamidase component PIG-S [Paramyrothecium foliicola]